MPLARWVPGLDSLLHYRRAWFRPDVQAGLSVAAIQIPTAIAYAQIAGFPPQVGLYACILPMLIYALIGSSRQLMVGPDAATAAMVAASIATQVTPRLFDSSANSIAATGMPTE